MSQPNPAQNAPSSRSFRKYITRVAVVSVIAAAVLAFTSAAVDAARHSQMQTNDGAVPVFAAQGTSPAPFSFIGSVTEYFGVASPQPNISSVGQGTKADLPLDSLFPDPTFLPPVGGSVALLAADPYGSDVLAKINASGVFSSVILINVGASTPTLAQLQAYDAVIVWSNASFSNSTGLGNNLADYVDSGKGVVEMIFSNSIVPLGGRWATGGYRAITAGGLNTGQRTLGAVAQPGHLVMNGVTSFDGGASSYRSPGGLVPGASLIASYDNGEVLAAEKPGIGGRVVSLNFFPPSSDARSDFWNASTDGAKLMANSLLYVGGPNISTLTPQSAVVNSGGLTLTVNGSNFHSDSIVNWNGVGVTTSYVSGAQLTATIPSGNIAVLYGSASITVTNPSTSPGTSPAKLFYLNRDVPAALVPTVDSPTVSATTNTTSTLGGTVTDDNGSIIQKRGVVYSLTSANSNPTIGGVGVTESDDPTLSTGTFTRPITGLTTNGNYSFAAFATNDIGTSYSAVSTFVASTSTTVSSISRVGTTPTSSTSVSWTVTYASSVSGVSTTNFSLTADPTLTGAGITGVTGSGTTYTVTASTGTGYGALRLDMANSSGVSPAVSNVPFTTGQSFAIDHRTTTDVNCSLASGPYNGAAHTCTVTTTSLVDGPLTAPSIGYSQSNVNASVPGFVTASATFAADGAGHDTSTDSDTFTITQKDAIWTTNPASKTFATSDPVPVTTGSGTGFLPADNVTATYSRVAGEAASPPTYHITAALSATGLLTNYLITNNGAEFTIESRNLSGTVTLANAPATVVPDVVMSAAGGPPSVSNTLTNASGAYTMTGFGSTSYTITPSKTPYPVNAYNGVFSNDATLISRHVVGLITLTPEQLRAAKVSGLSNVSSYEAALVAQYIVGINHPINQTGQWKFTPVSTSLIVGTNSTADFAASLMGDVNGDWTSNPCMTAFTSCRPDEPLTDPERIRNAVTASLSPVKAAPGSEIVVPFRIDNLRGKPVESFQFDIEYDPDVVSPAEVAASLEGTLASNMSIAYNSPQKGLLKVVVYGAFPASGDGVYVNLRFRGNAAAGVRSPMAIRNFRMNDGTDDVYTIDMGPKAVVANDGTISN